MIKHDFSKQAREKGWTMTQLAARWEIQPRQMANIARDPKQVHWDALIGLPTKHHHTRSIRANHQHLYQGEEK